MVVPSGAGKIDGAGTGRCRPDSSGGGLGLGRLSLHWQVEQHVQWQLRP